MQRGGKWSFAHCGLHTWNFIHAGDIFERCSLRWPIAWSKVRKKRRISIQEASNFVVLEYQRLIIRRRNKRRKEIKISEIYFRLQVNSQDNFVRLPWNNFLHCSIVLNRSTVYGRRRPRDLVNLQGQFHHRGVAWSFSQGFTLLFLFPRCT